ncbi:hypothetical protein ACIQUQ_33805 [Streptomyces sp. NPDC101118]|uniref:hypothetical protein n=1 Tax=unclassified Streptomyces TaxID=2593676 RepID=UPI0037CCF868
MFQISLTRRVALAGSSLALLGGGIALPATAMAAPAPQSVVTLAPADSADGIGTGGDANAENTTVGGEAKGGDANSGVGSCKGKCTITTGNATGGNASADAVNTGDATAVGGDGTGKGGTVKNIKKDIKAEVKKKLGK